MPAIACSYEHRVHIFPAQQVPEIRIGKAIFIAVMRVDQLLGRAQTIIAAITNRAKLEFAERKKVGKDASRPRADADHAKHNPIARRDGSIEAQNRPGHNHWRDDANRGALEKLAASNLSLRPNLHV